eukprot:1145863-Pelagomonas_calceolata.AAC.2
MAAKDLDGKKINHMNRGEPPCISSGTGDLEGCANISGYGCANISGYGCANITFTVVTTKRCTLSQRESAATRVCCNLKLVELVGQLVFIPVIEQLWLRFPLVMGCQDTVMAASLSQPDNLEKSSDRMHSPQVTNTISRKVVRTHALIHSHAKVWVSSGAPQVANAIIGKR